MLLICLCNRGCGQWCDRIRNQQWSRWRWAMSCGYKALRVSRGREGAEKRRLCGSPAAVTRRKGAGWRRWRLVSRQIVLFPTTACSSINQR
ncbi:unnamed protein product [Spirodela intermedia]|uniref:Uncharacterized protein n=1 Tax=Spirodela intermedia TaxID=51605 RepID=A0A7I8KUH9_SPIIN|nr:unnamed protein product [Spirodela intermedia]